VAVEKGRLERELQMAREVQASLLPHATPALPGWEFAARWEPAREVAGDYYDFIPGEKELGLVIADVSDKGMPAALFMALTRSIVRASAAQAHSAAESITRANRLICADATNSMFVTLFFARLDPATGDLTYVNAGHNPPWLYNCGMDELMRLTRTGTALGVDEALSFSHRTVQLRPGDIVLLYTDGVTDAINARVEEFGEARLESLVREHRHASAADLMAALEDAVHSFIGATQPMDDITLVAVKRL
jgi:sigma-B regulation protein RsbU (phosphoserine phosphatase)